jgi:hypothetical protein
MLTENRSKFMTINTRPPFAYGVRLFGEMHNDVVQPADPFEFVALPPRQVHNFLTRKTLTNLKSGSKLDNCKVKRRGVA